MQPPPNLNEEISVDRDPTFDEEMGTFDPEEQRRKELENQSFQQDMGERIRYANNAYGITQAWIGFLIVITIMQFSLAPIKMGLSDPAFIAVFTTTTASIFGFWMLVGRYLFNPGNGRRHQ